MAAHASAIDGGHIHPIDTVQWVAENQDWTFERISDDQIAIALEGQWRTYSITLCWDDADEMLYLICSFALTPLEGRVSELNECVHRANEACWSGNFNFWSKEKLMLYRYGLILTGGQPVTIEQIDTMIAHAFNDSERYYPSFQLAAWGDGSVGDIMDVAALDTVGSA